ncbi:MAG: methyltransferase domain-containing protein [Prosthecobacter sp.]|uniref:methyltransferase domain-containing protein n=1 Tax=Prosthecobacter sp. TaxID=1965333 RepID=UPI003900E2C4
MNTSHPDMPTVKELESALQQNINLMGLMRERNRVSRNTPDAILLSYDLQSGSYTALLDDPEYRALKDRMNALTADVLRPLGPGTLLEVGVGEASTLAGVISNLGIPATDAAGFDISWSRAAYARRHLETCGHHGVTLFTGDIGSIPLPDNAYDIVYTAHSLEPNGGRERECLMELHRIAKKWLVLFEPAYELGNETTRKRVEEHGYCRNLPQIARDLGYEVVEHALFACSPWDYNQSQQIIIRKKTAGPANDRKFGCPSCKRPLRDHLGHLFCEECCNVHPVIGGIPCLLPSNGVLATKFMAF